MKQKGGEVHNGEFENHKDRQQAPRRLEPPSDDYSRLVACLKRSTKGKKGGSRSNPQPLCSDPTREVQKKKPKVTIFQFGR